MAEVKRRSKRTVVKSQSEIEAQCAAKQAAKAAREHRRLLKLSERWKEIRKACREHARVRASQRRLQEAGVAWLMGYDTPAANMIARFVADAEAANREALKRKKLAGDPLNLTGEKPKLNKRHARERAEAERLARGERKIVIPDPDSPRQNVMVTSMAHSLRRVKMKIHQEPAAERFVSDWETAGYSGLTSPGFDPKVDSSATASSGHMRAAEAQTRLKMCSMQIGERNYDICRGVLIHNANASKIHAIGGRDHRTVSNDIDIALNALAAFYDPIRMERDPTWKAFKKVLENGDAVIKKLEEEVR